MTYMYMSALVYSLLKTLLKLTVLVKVRTDIIRRDWISNIFLNAVSGKCGTCTWL